MSKLLRYLWYRLYHHIYVPLSDAWWDFDHRNSPAPLADVCLICGKPGHREQDCPSALRSAGT